MLLLLLKVLLKVVVAVVEGVRRLLAIARGVIGDLPVLPDPGFILGIVTVDVDGTADIGKVVDEMLLFLVSVPLTLISDGGVAGCVAVIALLLLPDSGGNDKEDGKGAFRVVLSSLLGGSSKFDFLSGVGYGLEFLSISPLSAMTDTAPPLDVG
jgi:hypothetical protein